ncbi:MAG TPA: P1 family peptidase [Kiritimatiellia bacterium]|nr:P1 family peptidase [Kiritimatiellia bacterium]HPR68753.1 P1 family peptidase [Kiritimatiellia bacterium]
MRITIAYNLRTDDSEKTAELLNSEDVARLRGAIASLGHTVTEVEVSGKPNDIVDRLLTSEPDLIFNVAEGTIGSSREAFYPGLYEQLGIPFTGGNASLLHLNLDKHLAKTVLASRGIRVPQGVLITKPDQELPANLQYPLMIKPNSEGSSKGITRDSVVENEAAARQRIEMILGQYPAGIVVEEYITGKELSVPLLEAYPGKMLSIVEHTFDLEKTGSRYNIYDYEMKQGGAAASAVGVVCPAQITKQEQTRVMEMARRVFDIMSCPDMGRVDIRLHESGEPFFIELNPLPSLHPAASLMTAGAVQKLEFKDVIRLIIRSAARRYGLALRPIRKGGTPVNSTATPPRPTARELGIRVGRMQPGVFNSITDVEGVRVGHLTHMEDNVQVPGLQETSCIRAGVTAILPAGRAFTKRLVAGGFVLNGVGEMMGLTQIMEWGWLESPILLTNSHSVGKVHSGIISYMERKYPELGTESDVVIPVVGETDDSFLNDVRIGTCTAQDAIRAINAAADGPVAQGSIGAGVGMMSFDFAGGIGTSSRIISIAEGTFTVGVLVLSNFGKMRNLTVEGSVVGRGLDATHPGENRREHSEGSIIVVVATDIPLLSSQLGRIAKRAALGLGRTGSHAASTSGEIIVAFSTANRTPRPSKATDKFIQLRCISDAHINEVYEAVIEATEESVLNAIFCSNGMSGRKGRWAPAIPQEEVIAQLAKGRIIHESH